MIYIIYPSDDTTKFLLEIPKRIKNERGQESLNLIEVLPNEDSYSKKLLEIEAIPDNSVILFMGHGQEDKLWGAENEAFIKRPFITKVQSKVFSDKFVFLLSCNSNDFLKGTFRFSKIISSIGFGSLPTDMAEVKNSKRLKELGVNENIIEKYKVVLIELVSTVFSEMIEGNQNFSQLSTNFILRLNKKISEVILDDPTSKDNRILADLLFQMKSEMVYI